MKINKIRCCFVIFLLIIMCFLSVIGVSKPNNSYTRGNEKIGIAQLQMPYNSNPVEVFTKFDFRIGDKKYHPRYGYGTLNFDIIQNDVLLFNIRSIEVEELQFNPLGDTNQVICKGVGIIDDGDPGIIRFGLIANDVISYQDGDEAILTIYQIDDVNHENPILEVHYSWTEEYDNNPIEEIIVFII